MHILLSQDLKGHAYREIGHRFVCGLPEILSKREVGDLWRDHREPDASRQTNG